MISSVPINYNDVNMINKFFFASVLFLSCSLFSNQSFFKTDELYRLTGNNIQPVLQNKNGNLFYLKQENGDPYPNFWSKETGEIRLPIEQFMNSINCDPLANGAKKYYRLYNNLHFDCNDNCFMIVGYQGYEGKGNWSKLLCWNVKSGFQEIELIDFKEITSFEVADEIITIHGDNALHQREYVLLNIKKDTTDKPNVPPENPGVSNNISVDLGEESSLGEFGERLYSLEKLFHAKRSYSEKKDIRLLMQCEAKIVYDKLKRLQYSYIKYLSDSSKALDMKVFVENDLLKTNIYICELRTFLQKMEINIQEIFN